MKYKAVRGMEDILPESVEIWQALERIARRDLESWGYMEIRTPIVEDTSVFARSIGWASDIVTKEMYTFKDRKDRSLTLRPEGTASIVRSYIERSLDKKPPKIKKLYYLGPMFRSERPQKGRSRQFHQIGVELLGASSPYADAEVIIQLRRMLELFGLEDFKIKLNTLGCKEDKSNFSDRLKKYLKNSENRLCGDCKNRIKKNVLRVLDCKSDSCRAVLRAAPNILDSLCEPCKTHFDKMKAALKAMKLTFEETKNLVRGLDYYTGTVFEVTHPVLGGQDAIAAGGRYDNLVKDFGGPDVGAVGYALGMERVIIALNGRLALSEPATIYVAKLGDEAVLRGMALAGNIREELWRHPGIKVRVIEDTEGGPLKTQMKRADKNKASITVILGEDELKKNEVTVKNMKTGEQASVSQVDIVGEIKHRIGEIKRVLT